MNFLQLAQRVRQEIGGADISTVVSQTGENRRIVNWVSDTWRDIQLDRQSWKWMRFTATTQTQIGLRSYAATGTAPNFNLTRWARWLITSWRLYETAVGVSDESELRYMPYADFRRRYMLGTQNNERPVHITQAPSGEILIGPAPDKVYTLSGDYYKSAQTLSADNDIPECPVDNHMAIVWRALMHYGRKENAPDIYDTAQAEFDREMFRLERGQLEKIRFVETMVE